MLYVGNLRFSDLSVVDAVLYHCIFHLVVYPIFNWAHETHTRVWRQYGQRLDTVGVCLSCNHIEDISIVVCSHRSEPYRRIDVCRCLVYRSHRGYFCRFPFFAIVMVCIPLFPTAVLFISLSVRVWNISPLSILVHIFKFPSSS